MANKKSSGRGWLKWLAGIVVALVVLIVVALVVAPMLIPVETIRQQVTSAVKDATGRDLQIKGALSVAVFPTLAVEANDVTFSNASWASGGPMASLAKLDLHLRLLPLLSHRIEISSFVLEKPVFDLETDKSGHGNWEFAAASAGASGTGGTGAPKAGEKPAQPAAPAPAPKAESSGGGMGIGGIALGDVRIADGHITYKNGQTGKSETIDAINVKLTLANLDSPLALDGSAKWHDKPVKLTLDAKNPRALLQGPNSEVSVKLDADTLKLAFDGTLGIAGQPKGNGTVDISTPSVRGLVAWASGQPLTMPGDGLAAFSLKGKVTIDGTKYGLGGVQLGLDGMKGTGDLAVDTGGARPALKGTLAVDKLDLNHYMAPEQKGGKERAPAPASSGSGGASKPGTSSAPAQQEGWSDEPIDVSGLKSADVNLALAADAILWRKVEVGKTSVQITLDAGKLNLDLKNMALYQGDVKGGVQVDGSAPVLGTVANLKIDKVQVGPLLKALEDTDRVTGAVVVDTQLTSRGKSQRELVSALNGKGSLALQNGVIKGIDLVGLVKNAAASVVGGNGGETAITTASGTYAITNGILTNNDLTVSAPTLSATGAGTVSLPPRTVDYKLSAKLASALAVPVNVKGPWDNISWGVDIAGLAKQNLGNAANLVGSGAKGVGNAAGGAGNALKDLGGKLFGK